MLIAVLVTAGGKDEFAILELSQGDVEESMAKAETVEAKSKTIRSSKRKRSSHQHPWG